MRHAKAAPVGATPRRDIGLGQIFEGGRSLLVAAFGAALLALVFASSAQAVSYSYGSGGPLVTGNRTTSVAVNQSSGDVYVASSGSEAATFGQDGGVQRFSSAGAELSCVLYPKPSHPAGIAIDPSNGNIYQTNLAAAVTDSELRTYPAGCGNELASNTGTADTTTGSNELTSVAMAHPLQIGQGVSGPGLPTGTATGDFTNGSPLVTNVSGASGTFAVGQSVFAGGLFPGLRIIACIPNCASPSEIELSGPPVSGASGVELLARTTVSAIDGATVTLSNPAEATGTGVSISGTAWRIEASAAAGPIGQPTADASGNIYWPNRSGNKLQKLAPWGEELVEGSFPVASAMSRPPITTAGLRPSQRSAIMPPKIGVRYTPAA